jgi:hypothetical protein
MLLQNCQRNEQMKPTAQIIRPQHLPQMQHIQPLKLPLIPHQQHSKEEEEIRGVGGL